MHQGTSTCHAVEYRHTVELRAIEDSTASGTLLSTPMVSQTRPLGHGLHPEYSVTGVSNALVVVDVRHGLLRWLLAQDLQTHMNSCG
jgi:hypothetical protein